MNDVCATDERNEQFLVVLGQSENRLLTNDNHNGIVLNRDNYGCRYEYF